MPKITHSEAGKLGYLKSYSKRLQQQKDRIKEYENNPKLCKYCGNQIPYNKKENNFCNSSCFASFNNKTRAKRHKKQKKCLNCKKVLDKTNKKYCSGKCQREYEYKQYIKRWKQGEMNGMRGNYNLSNYIKKYLLKKANYKCEKCGWSEINVYTNKIPLEVHHKDGNYLNNSESNLEILCPNCHSLTSTYKNLNKEGRRTRVKKVY